MVIESDDLTIIHDAAVNANARTHINHRLRLERQLTDAIEQLPAWAPLLQEAASTMHSHLNMLKAKADKDNKRMQVVFCGESAFISQTLLGAAVVKHGSFGVSPAEWISLNDEENVQLYRRPSNENEKARTMLHTHGIKEDDMVVIVDDHYGMGIKAEGLNTTFSQLGYTDTHQLYIVGYPGTTEEGDLLENVTVASRDLYFTNFMRGLGDLLDSSFNVSVELHKKNRKLIEGCISKLGDII